MSNDAPISHAVLSGADEVHVLGTGHACALQAVPATALGVALQSLTTLISRQLVVDTDRYERECSLHVVPPLCPLDVSPADFGRADELIGRALRSTRGWLAAGHPDRGQAALLAAHRH